MAAFSLIPREEKFFSEFVSLSEQLRLGAKAFKQMVAGDAPDMTRAETIKEIEHVCDEHTRRIIDRLNRTFVTPLDREDIHRLAISLDDIMDAIDGAAAVIRLYKIQHMRPGARRLVDIIVESTDRICEALTALEKRQQGLMELIVRVNQLEREADRVHQDSIVALFDDEKDPISVIKWKEILDFLEEATDRCEDVANVIEAVVVKHA